jgi:eukaryotic-like serine/threonine-protein kinase
VPDEEKATWGLGEGDELAPGRLTLASLGGGELCETYLGWDESLFAVVVFKVMRPDRVGDRRSHDDLAREADMLRTVNHPVILRGFDAVLDGPRPHLVLEHLDGPTLRSLIRRYGPMPLEQLLPLVLHLCSGLHYLHRAGFVHLDVKPRNIIMGPVPRLIDLSIARTVERAARMGRGVGTPAYMAPEQCDPDSYGGVGPPADIWGLGATLYEAVKGKRPFRQRDAPEGVEYPQLVMEPSREFPRHVPAALVDLTFSCLEKDPAARPVARDVALALEPLIAGLPEVTSTKRGFRFKLR